MIVSGCPEELLEKDYNMEINQAIIERVKSIPDNLAIKILGLIPFIGDFFIIFEQTALELERAQEKAINPERFVELTYALNDYLKIGLASDMLAIAGIILILTNGYLFAAPYLAGPLLSEVVKVGLRAVFLIKNTIEVREAIFWTGNG